MIHFSVSASSSSMSPRSFSPRRSLALALALVLGAWANLDLAAFHGQRAVAGVSVGVPWAAQLADGGLQTAARSSHATSHQCVFSSVAHGTHTASFQPERGAAEASSRAASALALPRRIPGRTASGLAPPA